ncbi:MAG TPA: TonB-dependent receptor plug domain-containing protein, partial [Rhodopila sp.]
MPPAADATEADAQAGAVQNIVVSAPTASQAAVKQQQAQPVTSTIVTQDQLQNDQITDVQDAKKLEPSVQIKIINVRNIAIDIRGLGQASATALDGI